MVSLQERVTARQAERGDLEREVAALRDQLDAHRREAEDERERLQWQLEAQGLRGGTEPAPQVADTRCLHIQGSWGVRDGRGQ